MKTRTLICIVVIWCMLTLVNYYFVPYFIVAFEWLVMSLGLLIWTILQIVKLIKERKNLSKQRIISALIISILFLSTLYKQPVNGLIEKADWYIYYSKRSSVVDLVKEGKLTPNVSWNNWVCELPYKFPVISNGGNEIGIKRNNTTGKVTVTFWVFRNFFSANSTHFVYTNDPDEISEIENLIKNDPKDNWKIASNWYRTFHE